MNFISTANRTIRSFSRKATWSAGISRTEVYKGYRYDIGGHRFFTKVKPVQDLWKEVLPNDFLKRPRLSRIYYRSKYFAYPLKPFNALREHGRV